MKISRNFILSAVLIAGCKENTTIPGCNAEEGRFINGMHYVSGEMLTENNTWDYRLFQKYHDRRAKLYPDNSCIPIERDPVFEETLKDKTDTIDLNAD